MIIKSINLKDFRNYESLSLQFNEKVNLILGGNAQGKTNILEAIYISSSGKSFRGKKDSETVRFGCGSCRIFVETDKSGYEGSVEILINSEAKKQVKIDGVNIKKLSQLMDNIYTVIFSPEDLRIIKDEPEKRRKFIDRELSQIKPSYFSNLDNYRRVLIQRNAYLKENYIKREVLDVWDVEAAKYGSGIMHQRLDFIKKIEAISRDIHSGVTDGSEILSLNYVSNIKYDPDEERQRKIFYNELKQSYENDIRLRTTTKGPHKDDLDIFIETASDGNKINVRSFGSQGQQRTAALSLKLAELKIIKDETGESPILLLDDVMSELDEKRQKFLVKALSDNQLFITTTEIPQILINQFPSGRKFTVTAGRVQGEDY